MHAGVDVAMAADSGYVYPTAVAMHSLARHATGAVRLQLAVPEDWESWISERELSQLRELADSLGWDAVVTECPIKATGLPRTLHISPMTFMKPALFDIAPQERLLFIDGDLIAVGPWTEMADSLTTHAIAAAPVPAMEYFERKWNPQLDPGWYANAGVLVVAPNLWQELYSQRWRQLLAEYASHDFEYLEQDIMNAAMLGATDLLPRMFNACPAFGDEVRTARIVHYAGWFKPWLAVGPEAKNLSEPMRTAFGLYRQAEVDFMAHTRSHLPQSSAVFWAESRQRLRGHLSWRAHKRYWRWRTARIIKGSSS